MSYLCGVINTDDDMKTNMIISTDSRMVTRMAGSARRTGSELMAGAKAVLVEALKDKMRDGIAHFVFQKKDGSYREAWGTTNRSLAEKYINGNGVTREAYATTAYFDVEAGGWRSFRWENLVMVY